MGSITPFSFQDDFINADGGWMAAAGQHEIIEVLSTLR
jgi:hypothetical protein